MSLSGAAGPIGDPAPELPFASVDVLATPAGVAQALDVWSATSAYLGLDPLALGLFEAARRAAAGPPPDRREVDAVHSRRLLFAGRFADVLTVASDGHRELPEDVDELDYCDIVVATARAALGQPAAHQWLVRASSVVGQSPAAPFVAQCVALVGEARQDRVLADAAVGQLNRLGAGDRATAPAQAALLLAARSTTDPGQAGRSLGAARAVLGAVAADVSRDPQPVLDTARVLVERGDTAGARLLLLSADLSAPRTARVRSDLDGLRPGGPPPPGRDRRRGVAVVIALVAVVLSGGILALPLLLGRRLRRRAPVPGLSVTDSRLYRGLATKRIDPRTGVGAAPALTSGDLGDYTVIIGSGFGLGLVLAIAALAFWAAVFGRSLDNLPPALIGLVIVAGVVGTTLAAPIGWTELRRRVAVRRPSRRSRSRASGKPAPTVACDCWDTEGLTGNYAELYLHGHLQPRPPLPALSEVSSQFPDADLATAGCAETGVAWLRVRLAPEGAIVLLRSQTTVARPAAPRQPDPDEQTGMYL